MRGGGYNNSINKVMYIPWMVLVFVRLLFTSKATVWALGLETAFPAVLASYIRRHKVIFDDADRLVLLFNFRGLLLRLLRLIEKFTSSSSTFHIIPSRSRYDYESEKFLELKNLPTSNNIEAAKLIEIPGDILDKINGKVVVYANGWLADTRGALFIVDLIKSIMASSLSGRVIILLAGRIDSDLLRCNIDDVCCVLLPEMKYEQALSYYKVSDYVLTLYDPAIEINKFAEANKWGDALAFGVTPVVNKEVVSADFLKDVSVVVEYDRADNLIFDIENNRERYQGEKYMEVVNDLLGGLVPFKTGVLKALGGN